MAWTGWSLDEMTRVQIDLRSYVGENAILRFRIACDRGVTSHGWYIDDVSISGAEFLELFNSGFESGSTEDWG
mgnify:FL=1